MHSNNCARLRVSNTLIVFALQEMVALCHSRSVTMAIDTADTTDLLRRGVEVLVDGAHALGTLPISMQYVIT